MSDQDYLAQRFEERRPKLRAMAYRMLGSRTEADDAVQEAWLRLRRSDDSVIANLNGWLTTAVSRVCLDMLRSRNVRREESLEAHLPDLILSRDDRIDIESETLMLESMGIALLVVLQSLPPSERVAFVLHDTFGMRFDEIGRMILGCSPAAARQQAARARRRVRGTAPVSDVDQKEQRSVVEAFLAAARGGDFDALLAVLAPDVVARTDLGPVRELRGARAVAEGAFQFSRAAQSAQLLLINGLAGVIARLADGRVFSLLCFTVRAHRIVELDVIRDPERLRRLDLSRLDD
jgi:RNA polymerase sigma factor (sigma-70 family)